jgi:hypothetical protein
MSKKKQNNGTEQVGTEQDFALADRPESANVEDQRNDGDGRTKIVKSRRERFVSQAERRVNNAIKRLAQVANLGNRTSYEATDEEYNKILSALGEAYQEIRLRFSGGQIAQRRFTL